jgi:hypothetical protein
MMNLQAFDSRRLPRRSAAFFLCAVASVLLGAWSANSAGAQGVVSVRETQRADFVFEITQETAFGQSVFVTGNLPELGDNDPALAVRLSPRDFPVWRATVALPRGRTFAYEYILREDAADRLPDPTNAAPIGEVMTGMTPLAEGDTDETRVSVLNPHGFTRGALTNSDNQTTFFAFDADSPDEADILRMPRTLNSTWFLDNGSGGSSSGPFPQQSRLAYHRNGQVYGYPPPASGLSPSRIETIPSVFSSILGNSRGISVYLPRGYDENPNRVYPVVYMHDGQNIIQPGGPFG